MKLYLVFRCEHYYPSGGWDDLAASFETLEELTEYLKENPSKGTEDVHAVDLHTMEKI